MVVSVTRVDGPVEPAVAVEGGQEAEAERQRHGDERRHDGEEKRVERRGAMISETVRRKPTREAKEEPKSPCSTPPIQSRVALDRRLIEADLPLEGGDRLRRRRLAEDRLGEVAGQQLDRREDDDRDTTNSVRRPSPRRCSTVRRSGCIASRIPMAWAALDGRPGISCRFTPTTSARRSSSRHSPSWGRRRHGRASSSWRVDEVVEDEDDDAAIVMHELLHLGIHRGALGFVGLGAALRPEAR